MLVEFSVKNYRSFLGTQTLSMGAGSTKDLQEENTFSPPVKTLPRLLRSAVVYGPNGGGKSNLIKALDFMQNIVLLSSKESQEGESIKTMPFLLSPEGPSQAGEFEVIFIQDGIRYQYGFTVTKTRITDEWLLAYPGNRAQRWFERSYNPKTDQEKWYFGSKLTGPKKTWQESTRANALFLSTATQLNSEQLKPVFTWFQKLVVIRHGERIAREFTTASCEAKEERADILNFLINAGIEVDGITIKERNIENVKLPSDMPDDLKHLIEKGLEGKSFKEVLFKHQLPDSENFVLFPLTEESDGTQKLFAYAAPWLDVLTNGRVLIVDELDNSFHPHLVRYLLRLIHNSKTNQKNGQLIFSTHDTSILDTKILRRDQIWFVEKDDNQATQLYPLTDFHPRKKKPLKKVIFKADLGPYPISVRCNSNG